MSDVDDYIENLDDPVRQVAESCRELLHETLPDADVALKWGKPAWSGESNICSIVAHTNHVNLQFFQGANLDDPDELLEGTGKAMRHVKLRPDEEIDRDALVNLLGTAWEYDQT